MLVEMDVLTAYLGLSRPVLLRLLASLAVLALLELVRRLICSIAKRRMKTPAGFYHLRRGVAYAYTAVLLIMLGRIWIEGSGQLATFFGLVSAGLAIAMHDIISNLAAWVLIVTRKPFKVGDRIQIGETSGDVIDIRFFQFSMVEIGNWVDADQSTGRIIHVPNNKVFREPLANYETGFEYIWHEIPVLITFESNWKEAKRILSEITSQKAERLSRGAEEQIRLAAMEYLIYFTHLTPIVYTTVRDSGVLLTIRYIVKPRQRRGSEGEIWEEILEAFARRDDIQLAYPTTRFYKAGEVAGGITASAPAPGGAAI